MADRPVCRYPYRDITRAQAATLAPFGLLLLEQRFLIAPSAYGANDTMQIVCVLIGPTWMYCPYHGGDHG